MHHWDLILLFALIFTSKLRFNFDGMIRIACNLHSCDIHRVSAILKLCRFFAILSSIMGETIDQQFTRMLMRKVDTVLDFRPPEKEAEYGIPYYIVVPHSTFIKMGFDQADLGNILARYKLFGAVTAYEKFDNIPGYDFTPSMSDFERHAQGYFNKLHQKIMSGKQFMFWRLIRKNWIGYMMD